MQFNTDYQARQEHLFNLRREADNERLARSAQTNHPKRGFYRPLLAGLGRQMTNLGQRLENANEVSDDILVGAYIRE